MTQINDRLQELIAISKTHAIHVQLNFVMQDKGMLEIEYLIECPMTYTAKKSKHRKRNAASQSVKATNLIAKLKGHTVLLDLQSKQDIDALCTVVDPLTIIDLLDNVAFMNDYDDFFAQFENFVTLHNWCLENANNEAESSIKQQNVNC